MSTGRTWTFEVAGPTLNANDRPHWRVERRLKATWRDAAQLMAQSVIGRHKPQLTRARVLVTWVPRDRRRRDAENIAPVAKSIVDGIVRAGLLVDDNTDVLPHGPELSVGAPVRPPIRGSYLMRVTVLEEVTDEPAGDRAATAAGAASAS